MLSQPPPWSDNKIQNRQTSGNPRLEIKSTKGTNLCDPIDPVDKKEEVSLDSLSSDTNNVSHFQAKLTELDIRWKRADQAAKSKFENLQKRLSNILPKWRKSHHYKKEQKSYKKFWLATPNGHLLKLYSYKLED